MRRAENTRCSCTTHGATSINKNTWPYVQELATSEIRIQGLPRKNGGFSNNRLRVVYLGKENLSSWPMSKTGFLRFRISSRSSDIAVTRIGIAIVESQLQVTMLAS